MSTTVDKEKQRAHDAAMKTSDVIKHYGTKGAAARNLDISRQAIDRWGEYPPREQQASIHMATSGKLKAEPFVIEHYRRMAVALGFKVTR